MRWSSTKTISVGTMSERFTQASMLLLLGAQDNYTPAAPCRDYAKWFESKGADATGIVYRNAYHDFDSSRLPTYVRFLVAAKTCDGAIDLDRFTVAIRPTGEDITKSEALIFATASLAVGPWVATARRGSGRRKTSKRSSGACYNRPKVAPLVAFR